MVSLKELNLTNRFLFAQVMENPQAHQDVLSIIFGKEIPLLDKNETEKELRVSPLLRSIRVDVFSMDEDAAVYSTEMQDWKRTDLAKRSRYYQSLIDTNLLEPGIPNYNLLNDSYIIMIMTFDLFGYGKYCYTFKPRCEEVPECKLEDKAVRIFLNTKKNEAEVSKELVEFLHYVENTTDTLAEQTKSERIHRIHEQVCKVRTSEEMGAKYMQAWEEKYYEREEGRAEGLKEGIALGHTEGAHDKLKEQIEKKLAKGLLAEKIADELEEDVATIRELIQKVQKDEKENNG